MQLFPRHEKSIITSKETHYVSILGTIHSTRWRWNPFDPENRLTWNSELDRWEFPCFLTDTGGRHGDGIYICRLVINHNMRRVVKATNWGPGPLWLIQESQLGEDGDNIVFRVKASAEYTLCVSNDLCRFWVEPSETMTILAIHSMEPDFQLNGFPWDELDMFKKFDETLPGREFKSVSDEEWIIKIPLRTNGGIDFRHDGVYQFLISRCHNEDLGLSALNHTVDESLGSIQLISGTGFGSSHGTSEHSAPTVQVEKDGMYTFKITRKHSKTFLTCVGEAQGTIHFKNAWTTVHLLGTVHETSAFDPNNPETLMRHDESTGEYYIEKQLAPRDYVINFGFGNELFLDTMGLGCWLSSTEQDEVCGIGWHGKPNESNICFSVLTEGILRFEYTPSNDFFSIKHLAGGRLCRVDGIQELSLVGSFSAPLMAWDPRAQANLMRNVGTTGFEKYVHLEAGQTYEYKYVANRSDWGLVFADYELDGYGSEYAGEMNPSPLDTCLSELKRYGHLTTHGNPPALKFKAINSGLHRFVVDLRTGAYSVRPISGA
jgi:hypothetical protein